MHDHAHHMHGDMNSTTESPIHVHDHAHDHGDMDHAGMDHSGMDHSSMMMVSVEARFLRTRGTKRGWYKTWLVCK